jgi:hypothetical protein
MDEEGMTARTSANILKRSLFFVSDLEVGKMRTARVGVILLLLFMCWPLNVQADDASTMRDTVHDRLSMDISMVQRLHALTGDRTATRADVVLEAEMLARWLDDSLFIYDNAAAIGDEEWLHLASVVIGDVSRYRYALEMYLNALAVWSVTLEDAAITALNTEWLSFQRDYDALMRRYQALQVEDTTPLWFTVGFWGMVFLGVMWWFLRRRRRKREAMRPPLVQPVFRPRAEIIDVYDPHGTTPFDGGRQS